MGEHLLSHGRARKRNVAFRRQAASSYNKASHELLVDPGFGGSTALGTCCPKFVTTATSKCTLYDEVSAASTSAPSFHGPARGNRFPTFGSYYRLANRRVHTNDERVADRERCFGRRHDPF